jgi:hypothetical protein
MIGPLRAIKVLYLYNVLSPYIESYRKEFSLKLSANVILQALATTGQMLNQLLAIIPNDKKFWVAAGLALVQAAVGIVAHYAPSPATTVATN